jgi:hypothetical protein
MATLSVGQNQQYATIAAAVAASSAGDTITVQAGIYSNDWLNITHDLTLTAIGGWVKLVAGPGWQPPDGKAMITESGTVTISGFDISNVTVPDANGAAIRYQGGTLILDNVFIHDNQDGILAAADPAGSITIRNSEFAHNGIGGDGHTHNVYVGPLNTFTLTNSYIHDAVIGHEVKSRATNNIITGNRIFDNAGSASYSIDLPNGGNATIRDNIIQQGPNTQNPAIIAYGEEGNLIANASATIDANTIVNDRSSGTSLWNATNQAVTYTNNRVYGPQVVSGPVAPSNTVTLIDRPVLDLSPIAFLGSAASQPPLSPPPSPEQPPPPPPPTPTPDPPPPPVLSPLEQYHADVLADFRIWSATHIKLATMDRTLAVLNTELTSTTVLGIIKGDKWSSDAY